MSDSKESNWSAAADAIDRMAAGLSDPARVRRAADVAAETIRGHVYEGNGFAPLSAATQGYRGAGRPLQDTGSLRDSITAEATGTDTASVGTTKPYAAIQNNGGTIRAKKGWLFIPAKGTRQLQRRYGYSPGELLTKLKSDGYYVYRVGRTVCYRKRGGRSSTPGKVVYYLKKSVVIPARRFFYLTDEEANAIMKEAMNDII